MAWVRQSSSGKWMAKYRDADGRERTAPGSPFTHKKAAERAAAAAERDARSLGWRDPEAAGRTWGEWCDEWWPTRRRAASTMATDAGRIEKILRPRWGDVRLVDITRQEVKAWAAELAAYTDADGVERTRAAATVKAIVNLLSVSLAAAVDAEILPTNPAMRLALPGTPPGAERYLTREEFDAICEHLDGPYLAMTLLLVGTGLRWGEAAGLHRARVDARRGVVHVIEAWSDKGRHMKPYPKGRRKRQVPIPEWVDLSALEQPARGRTCGYRHVEGACVGPLLITMPSGAQVEYAQYAKAFRRALALADVGHARVHDLRHTYASWLLQSGRVSLAEVGKLLGHVSPLTTQRYAHLDELEADKVLAALGPAPVAAGGTSPIDELAARRARRQAR
ncbi:tyrosine-type recombinase/integrase [Puerhibacterium puerhi]|uniref:tyrosine-type recombinase/integrase n=1 Tax=Puerhibacterium puerhi TaxID=2692623 RepID=UPI001357F7BE|nr:site-specific integrase [Puerhibacterium puerhi]